MVALNFDRLRPATILNLNEVAELRGWSRANGTLRLGAGLTYTEAMASPLAELLPALAEASRTVGSPQIRNRGTIGGNLGTASPAGDALPPLLVAGADVVVASVRGERVVALEEFVVGVKRNALAEDELIAGVVVPVRDDARETFMKVGPRNAMVIAVVSLALRADERAMCRVRLGRACADRRARPCRRRRVLPDARRGGGAPDRRRARFRGVPSARAARADEACFGSLPLVKLELTVNGEAREADVWEGESLLFALRERLGLPGSKNACEQGECGSCSVLLDGTLVCACLVLAAQAHGHDVVTVEGLSENGELHRVQEAFVEAGAVQCGFCTPGLVVATADLLAHNPRPSDDEIREALSGNLCRCTGYAKIFDAVHLAAAAD